MRERQPLATTDQVAAYLQVSPRTVEGWAYQGTGPAFSRVGGQRRYRWQAVERWVEERVGQQVPAGGAA